ncbi:MAG: response regulator [Acidobacteriota bacterium]|nr:response regulator [Acidobacteriota bacterium]
MKLLNILLAEDNQGDVLLVRQSLNEHLIEHKLHVVKDGAEAVEFVSRIGNGDVPCPDLFLLDLNLPKVNGPEVLIEIRKHPQCTSKPIVIVTSSGTAKDRNRMSRLGISCYFQKPSDLDEFMALGAIVRRLAEADQAVF